MPGSYIAAWRTTCVSIEPRRLPRLKEAIHAFPSKFKRAISAVRIAHVMRPQGQLTDFKKTVSANTIAQGTSRRCGADGALGRKRAQRMDHSTPTKPMIRQNCRDF